MKGLDGNVPGVSLHGQSRIASFRQIDRDLRLPDGDPKVEKVLFPLRMPDPESPVFHLDIMPLFLLLQTDHSAYPVFRRPDHHIPSIDVHGNSSKRLAHLIGVGLILSRVQSSQIKTHGCSGGEADDGAGNHQNDRGQDPLFHNISFPFSSGGPSCPESFFSSLASLPLSAGHSRRTAGSQDPHKGLLRPA